MVELDLGTIDIGFIVQNYSECLTASPEGIMGYVTSNNGLVPYLTVRYIEVIWVFYSFQV